MNKFIIIALLTLLAVACNGNNEEIIKKSLTSEVIGSYENDTVFVRYPLGVKLKDGLFFLHDNSETHVINLYTYPDFEFIAHLGVIGKSREEIDYVGSFDVDDNYLYMVGNYSKKLIKYSLKDIKSNHNKPTEVATLSDINIPSLTNAKTESGFISVSTSGDRFILLDEEGKKINSFGALPKEGEEDAKKFKNFISTIWNGVIDHSIKRGITVVATKLGDVIEIYNHNTDEHKFIIGKGGLPGVIEYQGGYSAGKIDGYSDVKIVGNKIYAIFSGADRGELAIKWSKGENTPDGGKILRVFSLDGKQLYHYDLDRQITNFDIDTKNNSIVALDINNAEIVKYKL